MYKYFTAASLKDVVENVDNHSVTDFIK